MTSMFLRITSRFDWHSCAAGRISWQALRGCVSSHADVDVKSHLEGARPTTLLSNPVTVLCVGLCYVTLVLALRASTRHRELFFARGMMFSRVAAAHNLTLCFASLLMNAHVSWAIWRLASLSAGGSTWWVPGIDATICQPRGTRPPGEVSFALYVFLMSKVYELLDTVILVLRKRPLSLLHVWHHASVMFEVWAWLEYDFTLGLYGMWFNTLVHVFMYAYYAAAILGRKFRGKVLITLTQIVQFVTGFQCVVPYLYLHLTRDGGCQGVPGVVISALINGSYLALFILFYRDTYMRKKKSKLSGMFAEKTA